jgi:hypothetical protein
MKQTAMQDLRGDLILTIDSSKEGLLEIENVAIRKACQEVVRLTLKKIIKRIDDELLEMEKQQIIDAYDQGSEAGYELAKNDDIYEGYKTKEAEQYYNETFS